MQIALLTFAGIAAVVFGIYWLFVARPERSASSAVMRRLARGPQKAEKGSSFFRPTKQLSEIPAINALLGRSKTVVGQLELLIQRAGLRWTVGAFLLGSLCAGVVVFEALMLLHALALAALLVGAVAAGAPYFYVSYKADKRMQRFEELFPEAISLIIRALRAGHAFTTGLAMVAEEMDDPVGPEFRVLYDLQNFGMPLEDALKELTVRIPLLDVKFFVTAVLTQRDAGGNLAEVLENLIAVVRDRFKVKRQVQVITAHARISGFVLMVLPLALAMVILVIAPDQMSVLWTDPLGIRMLVGAVILQLVGMLVIRKIIKIEDRGSVMSSQLLLAIAAVFLAAATISGFLAWSALGRVSPERKRLNALAATSTSGVILPDRQALSEDTDARIRHLASYLPKSPKDMGRLQKRLARAGYHGLGAAVLYSAAEFAIPAIAAVAVLFTLGVGMQGLFFAGVAGIVGYMIPGLVLLRLITLRQKQIRNGLPDAIDLLIVCIEAGSSLDQAVVKASEELGITYPVLAEELRNVNTEIRAGKPRLEAFKNFAERTKVDDVRALVSMLVQTDRFGTSVAQALRSFADTARTRRRQDAEERAAKLGVKLLFPLVFCLFPSMYVVLLGPAAVRIYHALIERSPVR